MSIMKYINIILNKSVVKDAVIISILVGTILNIINQADVFLRLKFYINKRYLYPNVCICQKLYLYLF